jgi:hypothetical protein
MPLRITEVDTCQTHLFWVQNIGQNTKRGKMSDKVVIKMHPEVQKVVEFMTHNIKSNGRRRAADAIHIPAHALYQADPEDTDMPLFLERRLVGEDD